MHFSLVTLFPEYFSGVLSTGLMQKGLEAGLLSVSFHNPRDTTTTPHRTVDDRPYGGGPGMVMLPQPLATVIEELGYTPQILDNTFSDGSKSCSLTSAEASSSSPNSLETALCGCIEPPHLRRPSTSPLAQAETPSFESEKTLPLANTETASSKNAETLLPPPVKSGRAPGRLIYLSPKGKPLSQALARELAAEEHITLICGRYEGIDSRIETLYPVECVSVGDFVLNGGEAGAACLLEAVARLLPGFMGHEESGTEESFSDSLLEYKQFTRPENFKGISVPDILRSGNHEAIAQYRHEERLAETLSLRPDLLEKATLTHKDRHYIRDLRLAKPGKNLYCALVHHPVLDKYKNSVAVSLTNLDIHDICRSSCTYGLGGCFMVTPLQDQQELLSTIVRHWTTGPGAKSNPDRKVALEKVHGVQSIAEAIAHIETETGRAPLVYGTTAVVPSLKKKNKEPIPAEISLDAARKKLYSQPVLLLFGTGHGLAPEAKNMCHGFLPPIRWHGEYNHLSVRSACAIIFDRILGDWL